MVNIFGKRLKKLRLKKDFTQERLAEMLRVNRMTIVKWEKGTSEPSISVVRLIAHIFDVDYDYLIGEDKLTLFLIVMAERFTQLRKEEGMQRNEQIELAEWIIYWNDLLQNIYNKNYVNTEQVWEDAKNRIGWSLKYNNVTLKFPNDYSNNIIEYILNVDTNGLIGAFVDCNLPYLIRDMIDEYFYEEKPQLYKLMFFSKN